MPLQCTDFRVPGTDFMVQGTDFMVQGIDVMVQGICLLFIPYEFFIFCLSFTYLNYVKGTPCSARPVGEINLLLASCRYWRPDPK